MTARYLPHTVLALAAALCLATAATSIAQAPAGGPPQGMRGPRGPRPAPTNIQALPKDITGDDLIKLMRQYEGDLGVECEHCHAKDPATGRNNMASDANPMKDRARVMIRMTAEINANYLTQLTDPKSANPVTCGTCHQGMAKPAVFIPKPQPQGPRPAPPVAAPPK
jgi:hypothetical protein